MDEVTVKPAGSMRIALARRLQREFPAHRGRAILWKPECLHAAKGFYRTSSSWHNCASRWEAFPEFRDTGNLAFAAQSMFTMTECLKAKTLALDCEGYIDILGSP